MDQLPLHLSIAFFGIQIAAWAGLGAYLHMTHRRAGSEAALVAAPAQNITGA